jgi:NAD(P)-dependent dehydrogenase (short-subunit alcohol dehydrogenase family)
MERAARRRVAIVTGASSGFGLLTARALAQQGHTVFATMRGVLRVNRAVLSHMRRQGAGLVVYVSSGIGRLVSPFAAVYGATKWALEELAEAARYELAGFGVDVVIVQPGTYPTPIHQKLVPPADVARVMPYGAALQRFEAALGAAQTSSQTSDPRDVAEAIVALVELPAGQRPLRTVVAASELERAGTHAINEAVANVQDGFIAGFGLQDLDTLHQPAV